MIPGEAWEACSMIPLGGGGSELTSWFSKDLAPKDLAPKIKSYVKSYTGVEEEVSKGGNNETLPRTNYPPSLKLYMCSATSISNSSA